MCGIFAVHSTKASLSSKVNNLKYATSSLKHRGPDELGFFISDNCLIGHTRLSIIGVDNGKEPIESVCGNYIISFNGEIFNYKQLKAEFSKDSFTTDSDAEVLLQLFIKYGKSCLEKLHGMFSFVIYNKIDNTIFAARDRYGIKPLYFANIDGQYLFSSEIHAIYKFIDKKAEVDDLRLDEFLIFGYIQGSQTLHKDILELESGCFLNLDNNKINVNRYWWPVADNQAEIEFDNLAEVETKLDKLVNKSVASWMVADVPVGTLMSGGVDSPLVTSIASTVTNNIDTYSVCFADKTIDESENINLLLNQLKVNSHIINLKDDELLDNLAFLVANFDEPILDPNNLTLHYICKQIRSTTKLKVLLCGEGADEVFAGYGRYTQLEDNIDSVVWGLNKVAIPRLELIKQEKLAIDLSNRYSYAEKLKSKSYLNRLLEYDQLSFLTTRLHSQDRVGMLSSFEIRTPLLEHELTEYVNRLAPEFKIHAGFSKYILRKVAAKYIPDKVAFDKRKVGLGIPYSTMFKTNNSLYNLYNEFVLNNGQVLNYYAKSGLKQLLDLHNSGEEHSNTLWRILALELFIQSRNKLAKTYTLPSSMETTA